MKYGLIGEKLGHSYSKIIHKYLADYTYDLLPLNKEEFRSFMQKKDFTAINVTIPYKQDVIPYLDEIDDHAKSIGAVNTIVNRNGKLYGFNTDFYGFEYMIRHNNVSIENKKVLVLGDGGAAKAVRAVLVYLKASEILCVSRKGTTGTITYKECYENHADAQIIVNTTPLGMYPNIDATPIDLIPFTKCTDILDLIYNPVQTKLTLQAEELGLKAVTGLEMLIAQAKQAVEYFIDIKLEEEVIDVIYKDMLKSL
ncbi:MAG: shikimate dehydrogenase [Herbinix sp.]|jgi:shikimate dehydrogenase|nr:shikimate dehydrogenase [Herbinix sp.]